MRLAGERKYPHAAGHVPHSATSKAAADHVNRDLSERQRAVLCWFEMNPAGLTDAELDQAARATSTLRPRRCELTAKGLLVDSGITRPGPSGRPMTVWRIA